MRQTLLSIAVCLSAIISLNAATITFDFAANEFKLPTTSNNNSSVGDITAPIVKDGISISTVTGTAQYAPRMYYSDYNKSTDLRFYSGSSFSVYSTSGATITQIAFTCNAGKLDVAADCSEQWTGDDYSTLVCNNAAVVFTVNGSTQIKTITVTTSDEASCAAPIFDPKYTEFYGPTMVSLSCLTEGATIYYTIDGNNPTTASTKYTEPFEISKATTVKAIAATSAATSPVSEISYTFPEVEEVADIAHFLALKSENPIKITSPLTVTHQSKKYLFVKDASGALQIYGDVFRSYAKGDVIPAGVVGTFKDTKGSMQMEPIYTTMKAPSSTSDFHPLEAKVSDFTTAFQNTYVVCSNVALSRQKKGNNFVYSITDATGTLPLYSRFSDVTFPGSEGQYNVEGLASYYNGVLQLYPTVFTLVTSGISDVDTNVVKVIGGVGEINVIGAAQNIAIYSVGGAQISANAASVNCTPGLYIVVVDGKATKVSVK